jgi:amino acid adenylation domain-containing protein
VQNKVEGFRLSPQQERLWYLQQGGTVRLAQCEVFIQGGVEAGRLREAARGVVGHHEILRTGYRRLPGAKLPLQVVRKVADLTWETYDFSQVSGPEQEARAEELLRGRREAGPDPARDELLWCALVRLAADRHLLLLSLPSLSADAETLKNLVSEIAARYDGREATGVIQYAQFAEWQQKLLEEEDGKPGREFRQREIAAAAGGLCLPLARLPRADAPFDPRAHTFALSAEARAAVERAARGAGTTPAVFLFACWQAVLWRLTGRKEFTVGYTCDGRGHELLRGAMGLFERCLPLPCRLDGEDRFRELLARAAEAVRDADEYLEYFSPAPAAVEAAGTRCVPPLQTSFFYGEAAETFTAAGLTFAIGRRYSYAESFGVRLSFTPSGDRLEAAVEYDPEVFDAETAAHLAGNFGTLLEGVLLNPDMAVDELPLLDRAERRRLLGEFNETAAAYPFDITVRDLFERQAALTPDRPAVVCGDLHLTYASLNEAADGLACRLRRLGVGPEVLIGLCADRSAEMIVGLLGVLKAGGAYVPLDPHGPRQKLAAQLADSGLRVLLTQEKLLEGLSELGAEMLCLDAGPRPCAEEPTPAFIAGRGFGAAPLGDSRQLAYVIYTSGSTGEPKGVAVTHRGLLNYTRALSERLRLDGAGGGGLHFATVSAISADLGNTAIFLSLTTGGCLHVLGREVVADAEAFAAYASERPLDVLKTVPSHMSALLSTSTPARALPRRFLILGGEALPLALAAQVASESPQLSLINHYGPTETTVGSLTYELSEADDWYARAAASVPIGRPIANTRPYVLDGRQEPTAVGVCGELYVGGEGVARGYLGRPDVTAERFLPDPFDAAGGARMYRTGDLARHLPGEVVEFLGRVDQQVKVRGFRVELGEIEAALAGHPAVQRAAVVARAEADGEVRLAAYVVAGPGPRPALAELRSFLKERLPDYMVPASFVQLGALPRTPSGKIDRRALSEAVIAAEAEALFEPPSTPIQKEVAGIWADLLRVGRVGVNDNFFDLGGHSLLATRVISRLRESFGVEVQLRHLFDRPTVAGLAETIETVRWAAQPWQGAAAEAAGREEGAL